ncbi:MAG: hypothetical protein M3277_05840 [Actinomycetota bacterium]|nr:hypothetical protein [Actinomycetota bacterium]
MAFDRFLGALDRFAYRIAGPSAEDRAAGLELAVASRRFSRRTKAVVDDKLAFSATLMRAGEVDAANRLLAEVEVEVRTEEAALIEVVNEVKFEREINRKPLTRVAFARMMAAAMLSSTLLATSAVGMAVAGLFKEDGAQIGSSGETEASAKRSSDIVKGIRLAKATMPVKIGGVRMNMTEAELNKFRELTRGDFDGKRLETFLLGFLPPALAQQVQLALTAASEALPAKIEKSLIVVSERANDKRKEATNEGAEDPAEETEDPSPSPSESDGSDDGSGDPDDEDDDSSGLPIIGDGDDGDEG